MTTPRAPSVFSSLPQNLPVRSPPALPHPLVTSLDPCSPRVAVFHRKKGPRLLRTTSENRRRAGGPVTKWVSGKNRMWDRQSLPTFLVLSPLPARLLESVHDVSIETHVFAVVRQRRSPSLRRFFLSLSLHLPLQLYTRSSNTITLPLHHRTVP